MIESIDCHNMVFNSLAYLSGIAAIVGEGMSLQAIIGFRILNPEVKKESILLLL